MKIEKITIKTLNTAKDIKKEQLKKENNDATLNRAETILTFTGKERDMSSDFVTVNAFSPDEEITILYKQWEIDIYTNPNFDDGFSIESKLNPTSVIQLNSRLDFLLPSINYEIIYKEAEENDLKYYNSVDDLHTAKFFEVQDEILKLHVSFYIEKVYDGNALIVPEAKLRIKLKNPNKLNT